MKNFNVKQSGSEVILEEVNPYPEIIYEEDGCVDSVETAYSMNDRRKFTPLILTSIDPNIKVGQVIREDQLEPDLWQFFCNDEGVWDYTNYPIEMSDLGFQTRQVAKLKQPVHETPKSGHDLETCTEHNYIPGDDFYSTPTCIVCGYEATIGLDGKIKKELKPCGEGENICNCKSQDECGYIEIEKRIRDLETCTEKEEKPLPNDIDLIKLGELLKYSNKYEISIQFWPDQIAVYIMKDQVDLIDYGGDFDTVVTASINYLKRITKSHENRKDNR